MSFLSDLGNSVSKVYDNVSRVFSAPTIAVGKAVGQENLARSAANLTNPANYFTASRRSSVLLPSAITAAPLAASVAIGSPIPAALAYAPGTLDKLGLSSQQKNAEIAARIASGDTSAISDFVDSNLFPTQAETPNLSGKNLQAAQNFTAPTIPTATNWFLVGGIVLVPIILYFIFRKKGK